MADAQEDDYKADVASATTAKEISGKIIDHDYIRLYRSSRLGGSLAAGISTNDAFRGRLTSNSLTPFGMSAMTYMPVIIHSLGMY